MTSLNMSRNFVSGGGGGSAEDCQSQGAAFHLYRSRGMIDINENRVPNSADVSVAIEEPIVGYDAFVCTSAGTPFTGIGGVTSVYPGDVLVYMGGDVTAAASWVASNNPDYTAALPNCPSKFVKVVGERGTSSATG